jgi:hypothetical protein
VARAKHTGRAEARRRYRQATNEDIDGDGLEPEEAEGMPAPGKAARAGTPPPPARRPSFFGSFRDAYHPAHVGEDLRALPSLLRSRALLIGLGMVLGAAVAVYLFPNYTGTAFAWELLVLPGSALAPQLAAGFFATRASYLLGLIIGLVQGIVFTLFLTVFAARLGSVVPTDQMGNLLLLAFVTGPISGLLFGAAAAWYRRFLALSGARRIAAGRQQPRNAKPARRPAR